MKRFFFIGFCLLFFFGNYLFPQQESDNIGITIYSEESDSARRVGFRALDFFEPDRYRPDYSKFANSSFFDNMSISLYGGINGLFRREFADVGISPKFGLSISKYFNPYSGIALSASYSKLKSNLYNEDLDAYGFSVDYLFNLTNYINDFNPNSVFNLISVQGLGIDKVKYDGDSEIAYNIHWGLRMKFNTKTRLDFFIEPGLFLYTDGIDFSGKRNWRKYDLGYQALFGIDYSLGSRYCQYIDDNGFWGWKGVTLGFSGGVQTIYGASDELGFVHSLGPALAISVGKWFSKPAGMRISLFASGSPWGKGSNPGFSYLAAYGGGRLEAMVDLMGFSKNYDNLRFSIVPSAGLETGISFRQMSEQRKSAYMGITGALQLKYRLEKDLAFFVEPRFSYLPLKRGSIAGGNIIKDKISSLNFGVEMMNLGEHFDKVNLRRHDTFSPHFTFSAGIGGVVAVQQMHSTERIMTHMANIGLGYWFNPISGLRLDGSLGTVVTNMSSTLAQINISASLNYALNVLNLVSGYDSSRKWDAEIFAGPMVGIISQNTNKEKLNIGVQGGGRLSYKLPFGFDFYLEPRMYLYSKRLFPVNSGTPAFANLNLGGTYHFAYTGDRNIRKSYNTGFLDNTFAGVSMGGVNSLGNLRNYAGKGKILATSGAEYAVYLGKWITSYIGLRGSVYGDFYSYISGNGKNVPDRTAVYAGTGLEFMFNPFRLSDSDKYYIFELVPIAGVRVGEYFKQQVKGNILKGMTTSFTAAMQLRYNMTENMALVLEPRLTRSLYNGSASSRKSMVRDNILSLNLGVEMIHSRDNGHKTISVQRKDYEKFWFVSAGGGFNSRITSARYSKLRLGYDVELNGGYSFTPFSSVRLGYDFGWLPSYGTSGKEMSLNNISVDYLFDISNFVTGYDERRPVGLQLFGGPVMSVQKTTDTNVRVGVEVGAVGYVRLVNKLFLNLQPRARAFTPSVYNGKNLGRQLLFDFTAGLTYRF